MNAQCASDPVELAHGSPRNCSGEGARRARRCQL
jgi:hypothetical protein